MTASELKRKLAKAGCTFEEGTRHTKVILRGRKSQIPRHPSMELRSGTVHGILKQLGITEL